MHLQETMMHLLQVSCRARAASAALLLLKFLPQQMVAGAWLHPLLALHCPLLAFGCQSCTGSGVLKLTIACVAPAAANSAEHSCCDLWEHFAAVHQQDLGAWPAGILASTCDSLSHTGPQGRPPRPAGV